MDTDGKLDPGSDSGSGDSDSFGLMADAVGAFLDGAAGQQDSNSEVDLDGKLNEWLP